MLGQDSFREKINQIFLRKELIPKNYIDAQKLAEDEFGEKTTILIELGSFFEVYETEEVGVATDVSRFLNIILTKKNKKLPDVSINNPRLCGIPTVSLDKHLERLVEDGWNVVLVKQYGEDKNIVREVDKIITSGTNIDFVSGDEEHYLCSLKIEETKQNLLLIGLSLLEPTTGKVYTYESHSNLADKGLGLDEAIDIINKYNVIELIVDSEKEYFELETLHVTPSYKEIKASKISYQEQLISEAFQIKHEFLSSIEVLDLERELLASQSLTTLLKYVITNNKIVGVSLNHPVKIEPKKLMFLGNNPIYQLDVFNKALPKDLVRVINKGVSSVGKRFITNQILNPLIRKEEIVARFELSKKFIEQDIIFISKKLGEVYDLERLERKIKVGTIEPFEALNLYRSLIALQEISSEADRYESVLNFFNETFDRDAMEAVSFNNFSSSFISEQYEGEYSSELRIKLEEYSDAFLKIKHMEENGFPEAENLKLKESFTDGYFLEVSSKKFDEVDLDLISKNHFNDEKYSTKKLKNSVKIYFNTLSNWTLKVQSIKEEIKVINKNIFELFFIEFSSSYSLFLEQTIEELCLIEFGVNNVKLLKNKNYCIPEFIDSEDNFYEATELRHPIVEDIDREIFIPNTVQFGEELQRTTDLELDLGDNHQGYILYGQNSSGKTVLAKSVGLSVMMAQAGFFVPASSLKLSVYDSIFTRVVGSDDLSRGKSTFAMEMTELKNILNRGTKRSLVIGDEISHGTETTSGLSIVSATIFELEEMGASFILSTHLHELDKISGISELNSVKPVHLSLSYSEKEDEIKYNRKLQKGKGLSTYGLEFARSIKLPTKFIERAYKIRSEIEEDISGLEQLALEKPSKYNSDVYYGTCSKCGKKATEIHHINEQSMQDENGRVDGIKIHNKHNLTGLCNVCHDSEHRQ